MISLLLQHGADVNAVDDDGMSALHWACLRGHSGAARALILAGARYDLKDKVDGATAQTMAKNKGHRGVVELLQRVEAGGPDAASDQLSPAEWWAASLLPFWLGPGLMTTLSYTPLYLSALTLASSAAGLRALRNHPVFAPAVRSNPLLVGVFVALFAFSVVVYLLWVRPTFGSFEPAIHDGIFLLLAVATGVSVVGVGLMDPGTLATDAPAPNDMETVVCDQLRQTLAAVPTASASSRSKRQPAPSLCVTCRRRRPPRSKHCRVCRRCVSRMDHHCIWINNCVGAGNHGPFVLALAIATVTHSLYLATLVKLVATGWTAAPDAPDAVVAAASAAAISLGTPLDWLNAHWAIHPLVLWNLPLHAFMIFWMGALFVTQLQQVAKNLLTNEVINAHRYEGFGVAGGGHSHSLRAIKSPYDTGSVLGNTKALLCPATMDAVDTP
jgi:palmitoyltransferase